MGYSMLSSCCGWLTHWGRNVQNEQPGLFPWLPSSLHRMRVGRPQKVPPPWSSAWLRAGNGEGAGAHCKRQSSCINNLASPGRPTGHRNHFFMILTMLLKCCRVVEFYGELHGARKLTIIRHIRHARDELDSLCVRRHHYAFSYFDTWETRTQRGQRTFLEKNTGAFFSPDPKPGLHPLCDKLPLCNCLYGAFTLRTLFNVGSTWK